MARLWKDRIIAGTRKFADCPSRYQNDVLALLRIDVQNNKISKEKFEQLTGIPY